MTTPTLTTDLLVCDAGANPFGPRWRVVPLTPAGVDALDDEHVECMSCNGAQRGHVVIAGHELLSDILDVAVPNGCRVLFDTPEAQADFVKARLSQPVSDLF